MFEPEEWCRQCRRTFGADLKRAPTSAGRICAQCNRINVAFRKLWHDRQCERQLAARKAYGNAA
jgi:hypothetical protein